jgi:predicted nucleic acid-binding Zn ribbon protein
VARTRGRNLCRTCNKPCGGGSPTAAYCSAQCRPNCRTCNGPVTGRGRTAYCSGECAPQSKRLCPTCGNPINRGPGQHAYCSDECRPQCEVIWCNQPTRGTQTVCNSHHSMLLRRGNLSQRWRWAPERICIVCENPVPTNSGFRRYCSTRCAGRKTQNPNRPKSFDCAKCGITVSLITKSTKAGQFKRADATLCDKCARRTRAGMTVGQLARRDGTNCGICGRTVDLTAPKTDPDRPSIDHILPRAAGGTNDPANLQLAHLSCNHRKHVKILAKAV